MHVALMTNPSLEHMSRWTLCIYGLMQLKTGRDDDDDDYDDDDDDDDFYHAVSLDAYQMYLKKESSSVHKSDTILIW